MFAIPKWKERKEAQVYLYEISFCGHKNRMKVNFMYHIDKSLINFSKKKKQYLKEKNLKKKKLCIFIRYALCGCSLTRVA